MQVMLTIDDHLLEEMQTHAEIAEKDLNMMLSDMFRKYVADPGDIISEEIIRDTCEEFENFHMRMINFLTITAHDPKNATMREVLLNLREHVQDLHIMIDLYKTYKATR